MSRVMLSGLISLVVAGCSLGYSKPVSYGLTDASETGSSSNEVFSLGDQASGAPRPRPASYSAKLDDRAPAGSFERAPHGSLASRDYAATTLSAEQARDLINAYRKQKGLKPVRLDPALTAAAKEHARDLAKWDRISHFGSDGSNPWDRVKRSGYQARLAAENVGTGQIDFEEVLRGWQQSPGHNKNLLLPDAQHIGIALVTEPKTEFKTFWALVLASPM